MSTNLVALTGVITVPRINSSTGSYFDFGAMPPIDIRNSRISEGSLVEIETVAVSLDVGEPELFFALLDTLEFTLSDPSGSLHRDPFQVVKYGDIKFPFKFMSHQTPCELKIGATGKIDGNTLAMIEKSSVTARIVFIGREIDDVDYITAWKNNFRQMQSGDGVDIIERHTGRVLVRGL